MEFHTLQHSIAIKDAHKHNLKHLDLNIPKNQLVVITGISGSGKSSLAFDTIFNAGQQRYWQCLSLAARQHMHLRESPAVASIAHLPAVIALDQFQSRYFHAMTVASLCGMTPYLRLLYAKTAAMICPVCKQPIVAQTKAEMEHTLLHAYEDQLLRIFAPLPRLADSKQVNAALAKYRQRGFIKAWVDGQLLDLDHASSPDVAGANTVAIQIDALEIKATSRPRIQESLSLALQEGNGHVAILAGNKKQLHRFSLHRYCSQCGVTYPAPEPLLFSPLAKQGACPVCRGRLPAMSTCEACAGSGLNAVARHMLIAGTALHELVARELSQVVDFFDSPAFTNQSPIQQVILPHIRQRLHTMQALNLNYLTLDRTVNSLSKGEIQRCRLVAQLGLQLTGVAYIFDEPSIGLHALEQAGLLKILKQLQGNGNTLIVVEHDERVIQHADWVIEMGPGGGAQGGAIMFQGRIDELLRSDTAHTAAYLRHTAARIPDKGYTVSPDRAIAIASLRYRNLNIAQITIPWQALTVVCGVSGAGKSTLVMDQCHDLIRAQLDQRHAQWPIDSAVSVSVPAELQRVIPINQSILSQSPRSCVLTYLGLLPLLAELFAHLPLARVKGYTAATFSLAQRGGRCEICEGMGVKTTAHEFLAELQTPCPACAGRRYQSDILSITYKHASLADIFAMTVEQALQLFGLIPHLAKPLQLLHESGLGYVQLGQATLTLSGGESQRLKLCRELAKASARPTLFLIDEPTIGLHFSDIFRLLNILFALIRRGHTVVVIEHQLDIIACADHIIELGPGGGRFGGTIVYQGSPDKLHLEPASPTGRFMKENE